MENEMSEEKVQDESVEDKPVNKPVDKYAAMMAAMDSEDSDAMELLEASEVSGPIPSIFEQFETDEQAEKEGRWTTVGLGIEFKLRRFTAQESIDARIRGEKVVRKRDNNMTGDLTGEQALEVLKLQLAGGVIADWRGEAMRDENGPLPFTPAAAFMILDRFNELTQKVSEFCMEKENYRRIDQDETVKNS